jgi:hypothetical protein
MVGRQRSGVGMRESVLDLICRIHRNYGRIFNFELSIF